MSAARFSLRTNGRLTDSILASLACRLVLVTHLAADQGRGALLALCMLRVSAIANLKAFRLPRGPKPHYVFFFFNTSMCLCDIEAGQALLSRPAAKYLLLLAGECRRHPQQRGSSRQHSQLRCVHDVTINSQSGSTCF